MDLVEKTGISRSTLHRITAGKVVKMTGKTALRLHNYLNLSDGVPFRSNRTVIEAFREFIYSDEQIAPERKEGFYEMMRAAYFCLAHQTKEGGK